MVPEWEELELAVDSGASETVIGEEMVKAVTAQDVKPDVKYEVADGSQIPHMGEKEFTAFTDGGLMRNMVAPITEVNKALLIVSRIVKAGNRVVFDSDGSYSEHKTSGEWIPLEEKRGKSECGSPESRSPLSKGRPGKGWKTLPRRRPLSEVSDEQTHGTDFRPWSSAKSQSPLWANRGRGGPQLEGGDGEDDLPHEVASQEAQ